MIRALYLLGIGRSNVRSEDIPFVFVYLLSFIAGGVLLYAGVKIFLKYNRIERESASQATSLDYNQPLKIGHTFLTYFRYGFISLITSVILGVILGGILLHTIDIFIAGGICVIAIFLIAVVGFMKNIFSRLTVTSDELIVKGVFTEQRIAINDLTGIHLKSSGEPLSIIIGDITITFVTKDKHRYKWFCDSFKSLDSILEYIRHFVPGINVEMTGGFKMNRGAHDFLNKPLFQKKESDKNSK